MASKAAQYAEYLVDLAQRSSQEEFKGRMAKLAKLLRKRGEARLTNKIVKEFEYRWQERQGRAVTVLSGTELSSAEQDHIIQILQEKGYAVKAIRVNPDLKGGIALMIGNEYLVDGTIQGKLNKLRRTMSK